MIYKLMFFFYVLGVNSMPLDEPIRIDLPVFDQPQSASSVHLTEPLETENHPGQLGRDGKSAIGNLISHKTQTLTNVLNSKVNSQSAGSINSGGFFSPPVTKIESAILETEGLGSKTLSVKENIEHTVGGFFQPKPIVDTIREEEKYGNTGDKFESAGRAVVNGAEGFSNFINSALAIPGSIIKSIARAATEKLNNFGGKLVGL